MDQLIKGKYAIKRLLGKGGMGKVYLALDVKTNINVAIKQVVLDSGDDKGVLERFKREYYFLSAINHCNIIKAFDFFQEKKAFYLVLEYVDGLILGDFLLQYSSKINLKTRLAIATQLATGIDVINTSGVIHRDIKPSNIMIDIKNNLVKILDLGIAKSITNQLEDLTKTHGVIGTPDYMSPEQVFGKVAKNTDVFSVGVVLYQLFSMSKRSPFRSGNIMATMSNITNKILPPLQETFPLKQKIEIATYNSLNKILAKALEKDTNFRFSEARILSKELNILYNRCPKITTSWNPTIQLDKKEIKKLKLLKKKYRNDHGSRKKIAHKKYTLSKIISTLKEKLLILGIITFIILTHIFMYFSAITYQKNIQDLKNEIKFDTNHLKKIEEKIKHKQFILFEKTNKLKEQQKKKEKLRKKLDDF